MKYCRDKKKPLLTTAAQKRLAWVREYIDFDWSKVLFADESKFCLVSDRPVTVRRRQGEEYLPECLNTTMKHGGGGIMVWGGFAKNGVGRLHKVTGKINANHYKTILNNCVLPSMQHLFGEAILQQDNATCHVANSVKSWAAEKTCKFFLGQI